MTPSYPLAGNAMPASVALHLQDRSPRAVAAVPAHPALQDQAGAGPYRRRLADQLDRPLIVFRLARRGSGRCLTETEAGTAGAQPVVTRRAVDEQRVGQHVPL